MDPHQVNLKGLQLNARYYEDIKREWSLCKRNLATLEDLSISAMSMIWNMDTKMIFSKLTVLQIFVMGYLTIDERGHKQIYADWTRVKESIDTIQRWMSFHSFPALERLEIQWSSNLLIEVLRYGELDKYDKDGPIYETDSECEYEYINMDAVLYHYGKNWMVLDIGWMNALHLKEVQLAKAIFESVENKEYSFVVKEGPDFTQEEEDTLFEKLEDY